MPLDRALADFWFGKPQNEKAQRFTDELVRGVRTHLEELDAVIQQYAANWRFKRISSVDRCVLRLALFEIMHRPDIPQVVAINEAVEIAKQFSGEDAGKFVNGILDQARKRHIDTDVDVNAHV